VYETKIETHEKFVFTFPYESCNWWTTAARHKIFVMVAD